MPNCKQTKQNLWNKRKQKSPLAQLFSSRTSHCQRFWWSPSRLYTGFVTWFFHFLASLGHLSTIQDPPDPFNSIGPHQSIPCGSFPPLPVQPWKARQSQKPWKQVSNVCALVVGGPWGQGCCLIKAGKWAPLLATAGLSASCWISLEESLPKGAVRETGSHFAWSQMCRKRWPIRL